MRMLLLIALVGFITTSSEWVYRRTPMNLGGKCPTGREAITTEKECRLASEKIGRRFATSAEQSNAYGQRRRQPYCWWDPSLGWIAFNPAGDMGSDNGRFSGLVCKEKEGCPEHYEKVNGKCEKINWCNRNRGGCHEHATCTNNDGTAVCKCKDGYDIGNGYYCENTKPIIKYTKIESSYCQNKNPNDKMTKRKDETKADLLKRCQRKCNKLGDKCAAARITTEGGKVKCNWEDKCDPKKKEGAKSTIYLKKVTPASKYGGWILQRIPMGQITCPSGMQPIKTEEECIVASKRAAKRMATENEKNSEYARKRRMPYCWHDGSLHWLSFNAAGDMGVGRGRWSGLVCKKRAEVTDPCQTDNGGCSEHATCTNNGGTAECDCKDGYDGDGDSCEKVNPCETNNGGCSEHATCTNNDGTADCSCKDGYEGSGESCEKINPCETNHGGCSEHATCTNNDGTADCNCKDGYEGTGESCEKVNPCKKNHGGCHEDASCNNNNGVAECKCLPGFEGTGKKCTLIHPCDDGSHGCEHNCMKDGKSYKCTCHDLYDLQDDNKSCVLINPCETNNGGCSEHATCTNNGGTADCNCKDGYEGTGESCEKVNPCKTNHGGCSVHATCTNHHGTAECNCKDGYEGTGESCVKINPCHQNNGGCSEHATCINNDGTAECHCANGYEGNGKICEKKSCMKKNEVPRVCASHLQWAATKGKFHANREVYYPTIKDITKDGTYESATFGDMQLEFFCNKAYMNQRACSNLLPPCGQDGNPRPCPPENPCKTNHGGCSQHATCTNNGGVAKCNCKSGFEGNGETCTESEHYYIEKSAKDCDEDITTKEECEKAAGMINAFEGNKPGRHLQKGDWPWVPSGCSVQVSGDWSLHLNSNDVYDTDHQYYVKNAYNRICKGEPNEDNKCVALFDGIWVLGSLGPFEIKNGLISNVPGFGDGKAVPNHDDPKIDIDWTWLKHGRKHQGKFSDDCNTLTWENGYSWGRAESKYTCTGGHAGTAGHLMRWVKGCRHENKAQCKAANRRECEIKCDLQKNCAGFDFKAGAGKTTCRLFNIEDVGSKVTGREFCAKPEEEDETEETDYQCSEETAGPRKKVIAPGPKQCNVKGKGHCKKPNRKKCEEACEASNKCVGFDFMKGQKYSCRLFKTANGIRKGTEGREWCQKPVVTVTPWKCLEGKGGKAMMPKIDGCGHRGVAKCNASKKACQLACEGSLGCVAFDYRAKRGKNTCRLFNKGTTKDIAKRKWCPKDQSIFEDACKTNHGGCSEHATCKSHLGKATCTCKDGYIGDGHDCNKPNPCLKNHGGCHKDAFCTNDDGTAKCTCNEHFEGNGKECTLIRKCADNHSCQHICEKTAPHEYECSCHEGYKLMGLHNCMQINPCDTENGGCSSHANCENDDGTAKCTCEDGYEGDGKSCTKVNPCEKNNGGCDKDHGSCTNDNGVAVCKCDEGFEGNGKECKAIDPCENNGPCGSNFDCFVWFGKADCRCKEGMELNIEKDDCEPINPCKKDHGGCNEHATCANNNGVAKCTCKDGYEGDGETCTKIDPCTKNHGGCHEDASCTNNDGTAVCKCHDGFEGNGKDCKKIHPCDDGSHGCQHECTKQGDKAVCVCHDLYELKEDGKSCQYIDACVTNHGGCSENAHCTSEEGIAKCTCKDTYQGDGKTCTKINPCLKDHGGCSAHASCTNNNGAADCLCNEGYEGDGHICTKIDPCHINNGNCHAEAICTSDGETVQSCECKEGLVGDEVNRCETEEMCMKAGTNPYHLIAADSYLTGYNCGHKVYGDWAYGECASTDSRYYICKSTSSKTDNCAKHDPPILTQQECAAEVDKKIKSGECHPNGYFYSTLCNAASTRSSCICQSANGQVKGTSASTVGNDVFQTLMGKQWEEADPCVPSPCHADAECKVYKGLSTGYVEVAQCRCKEPLVGDGIEVCETEQKCMTDPVNIYKTDAQNKRFSGYSCGHSVPGDWKYGQCDETKSQFRICRGFSTDPLKSKCLAHDPPIRNQDDCAKVVEQLVKDGICHSSGLFMSTFCAWSGKHACVCMLAGGKKPKYYDDENLNDIFMLNSGIPMREPCEIEHGGCLSEASCTNYKGKAICQCQVPKVGDGETHCESESTCMGVDGNTYSLLAENKYLSGDRCGHGTPGDWKYGECDATKTNYALCRAWSPLPEKNSCHMHDPPIKSQDDCAKAVQELIKKGICHPNGRFYSTFCHAGGKPTCTCQLANGAEPRWYKTTQGYDLFELIPDDPCLLNNGGCLKDGATCENVDGNPVCTCNEGLVGDGEKVCETEYQCLHPEGNEYDLVKKDKYLSGERCGHQTPGDWKYGKCTVANSKYAICNSYSTTKNLCHKADPPIKSQDDCAATVRKLIGEGVCHENGQFFGTFCNANGKMSCYCQVAGGATPKLYTSTVGNDVLQLKNVDTSDSDDNDYYEGTGHGDNPFDFCKWLGESECGPQSWGDCQWVSGKCEVTARNCHYAESKEICEGASACIANEGCHAKPNSVEIEIGNEMAGTYTNYLMPFAFCLAAFGMGYYFSNHKNNRDYTPLLDNKATIEMQ